MLAFTKIGFEVETTVRVLDKPVVCDFLPYTKEAPLEVDGSMLHKDASMLEIAMPPCSYNRWQDRAFSSLVRNVNRVWESSKAEAEKLLPAGAVLSCDAAVEYTNEELAKDPYASVLGCSQSFNVYTGFTPTPPEYANNLRYAGLHLTASAIDRDYGGLDAFILDTSLGLTSVLHHEQDIKDQMVERRKYYGRAGEYRLKRFGEARGIEYRTLPASTWERMGAEKILHLTQLSRPEMPLTHLAKDYALRTQDAINNCDAEEASALLTAMYGRDTL